MSTVRLEAAARELRAKPVCQHCGAALIDDRMRASGFCCAGCSYVYRLVHEHGLAGYYRIKDDVTAPADAAVFQPRDYAWLETAQRAAEAALVCAASRRLASVPVANCVTGLNGRPAGRPPSGRRFAMPTGASILTGVGAGVAADGCG